MEKFPSHIFDKLGWYVYGLQDPRNGRIFYIGKGKENRVFSHANSLLSKAEAKPSDKLELIKEITREGYEVKSLILRHAIPSEAEAYRVESVLIDFCSYLDSQSRKPIFGLTNMVQGHSYKDLGIMTAENVKMIYHAPKCPPISEKAIMLKIPVLWTPSMTPAEVYEAARGWWVIGKKREEAEIALAINNGIVRGVYGIKSWRPRVKGDRDWTRDEKPNSRWGFDGVDLSKSSTYNNTSVTHLFLKSSQNPLKYINF